MLHKRYISKEHNLDQDCLFKYIGKDTMLAYPLRNGMEEEVIVSLKKQGEELYFTLPEGIITDSSVGDLYIANRNGSMRKVFATNSSDNVLFVTEQCNNHCLMCSQPPVRKDDIDFYFALNSSILRHMPTDTSELGITGGEPTLLGKKLSALLDMAYDKNPQITLHILSNGRAFANRTYASLFAPYASRQLVIGVPFHSDFSNDHNKIAGHKEAYVQTLTGLYNLARYNIPVEIRVVINKLNYKRLPQMATFIFRNFPFVTHVAFMGMEYRGLILKHYSLLGVDATDYGQELTTAVYELKGWGINTSIYNIPLCLLPEDIRESACRSISDWKETYIPQCKTCSVKEKCCGLFSTSHIQSPHISPL